MYYEDEEEKIDYSSKELGELQEIIGEMENNIPRDKRSKAYRSYIKELNSLFDIYNTKCKWKAYTMIR